MVRASGRPSAAPMGVTGTPGRRARCPRWGRGAHPSRIARKLPLRLAWMDTPPSSREAENHERLVGIARDRHAERISDGEALIGIAGRYAQREPARRAVLAAALVKELESDGCLRSSACVAMYMDEHLRCVRLSRTGTGRRYRSPGMGSYAELPAREPFNRCGDPGGIRTRDLDLERVASLARLDDGVPARQRRHGPARA